MPEGRKRINLEIGVATHTAVKVYCARRGETIQQALERLITDAFARVDMGAAAPSA